MLDVVSVGFSYGDLTVLNDITFSVKRGEFFAIAGPNGAGKSTLVKILGRFLKPEKGRLFLNGKPFEKFERKEFARKLTVVGQNPSYGFMKVGEFVFLGRIPYLKGAGFFTSEKDRSAVDRALDLCGIEHLRDKYMNQLSGGQRQMAFIARAIATEADIMVMDEPLSSLDVSNQQKVISLMGELREKLRLTIVAVLHDLNIASEFADRVLLLKDGGIFAMGEPSSVLTEKKIRELYASDENVKVFINPLSGKPFVCITKSTQV